MLWVVLTQVNLQGRRLARVVTTHVGAQKWGSKKPKSIEEGRFSGVGGGEGQTTLLLTIVLDFVAVRKSNQVKPPGQWAILLPQSAPDTGPMGLGYETVGLLLFRVAFCRLFRTNVSNLIADEIYL